MEVNCTEIFPLVRVPCFHPYLLAELWSLRPLGKVGSSQKCQTCYRKNYACKKFYRTCPHRVVDILIQKFDKRPGHICCKGLCVNITLQRTQIIHNINKYIFETVNIHIYFYSFVYIHKCASISVYLQFQNTYLFISCLICVLWCVIFTHNPLQPI
jgi:hypothetical protein